MAISCTGCRYLSAFGTICLLGRERHSCRAKAVREDAPDTMSEMILKTRMDAVLGERRRPEAPVGTPVEDIG
jgi:hypothetical protein